MTWEEFERRAVPEDIRRREASKNVFVPLSRWVAVREAFVLHHLGVTGNMVSLFRLVLCLAALVLFGRLSDGALTEAGVGVGLMAWQLNLDGVDGALARAQEKVSRFGDALDNLGIDYARTCFWVLAGAMTGDLRMVIFSALAGYLLVPFRQYAAVRSSGRFDQLARNFMYIPVLWVVVPLIMIGLVWSGFAPSVVAYAVTYFYVGLALVWFLVLLRNNLTGGVS